MKKTKKYDWVWGGYTDAHSRCFRNSKGKVKEKKKQNLTSRKNQGASVGG